MEKYGFAIRFYPAGVMDEEANIAVELNTWDGKKIVSTSQTMVIAMEADLQTLAKIHEPAWAISVLELAGHAIADMVLSQEGGWNSGTCASPIRASETLTQE